MRLSINPSYHCNFSCEFCYLSKEQLRDKKRLRTDDLFMRLSELPEPITGIDLYGGEIGLLDEEYFENLKQVIRIFYRGKINVITNFSATRDFFFNDDIDLSVSFDFNAREQYHRVLENLRKNQKDVSILMLASWKMVAMDVDRIINVFNEIPSVKSVEIKPYSKNKNQTVEFVADVMFETVVKKFLINKEKMKFKFINLENILNSLGDKYDAFSNDHVYITPNGKFAVLEFDENSNEYFKELDDISELAVWVANEKEKITKNKFCGECKYLGRCLTEHYREVTTLENSCNGFKHLLEWYERVGN